MTGVEEGGREIPHCCAKVIQSAEKREMDMAYLPNEIILVCNVAICVITLQSWGGIIIFISVYFLWEKKMFSFILKWLQNKILSIAELAGRL